MRTPFLAILGLLSLAASQAVAADRPNILWISCEDISPDLGCYGDAYARSPNIDKLATQGARFTRAFSVAGVCAPSRSSIITAMHPTTIGTHHMRCKGVPPAHIRCFTEYLRGAGYYCTNNVKTDYNFDVPLTAWDQSSAKAHWRSRGKGQPFFAVFNFITTHESKIRSTADEFATLTKQLRPGDRHDPAKAKLPPYYPDTAIVRNDWARYHDLITAMDLQVADVLKQLEEDGLSENTIVFYWSDHGRGLPRAKRWIYDSGIHVPLIVRWPGKVKPGSVRDDLVSLMDLGPTAMNLAGIQLPAHLQGRPFLGDNLPAPREHVFAARDRMDETYDIIRCVRDKQFKYLRNFQPGKPYAQYIDYMEKMPTMQELRRMNKDGTLVGPQKLFFLPEKPEEELYDTAADPHEVINLAKKPEHQETLKRLRAALEHWRKDTKDLGLIPEDELKEKARPGGKWSTTAIPEITPKPGTYKEPVSVKITCPTEGASIAYTTDLGETPRWQLYTKEFVVTGNVTVRIRACRLGFKDSDEARAEYKIAGAEK